MSNEPLNTLSDNKQVDKASIFARRLNWSSLSYPQKFTVIAIIFALPLIAFAPLIVDRFTRIEQYGYKEFRGAVYLRQIWQLTGDIQLFHSAVVMNENGLGSPEKIKEAQLKVDTDLINLKSLGEQYNASLEINSNFDNLQTKWDSLKNNTQNQFGGSNNSEGDILNVTQLSALYAAIGELIKQVGDKSYLILDPDLDTYYMMETVLIRLPENQALTFELWRLADGVIANQDLSPSALYQTGSVISLIETNLSTVERSIQTALQNNSGGFMSPIVSEPLQDYLSATRSFTDLIRNNILESESIQINSEDVYTSYGRSKESINIFYEAASQALETGIQTRINSLNIRLYSSASFAILSVLAATVIGLNMMRSINLPLLDLISATEKLAAGKMSTRIAVTNLDEVGRAALTFNQMAEDIEKNQTIMRSRTGELEQRSLELETIAEVAREITIIHDLSTLLNVSANLIRERFNYYHVGIFLVDEGGEYAILRAASSNAANLMLEQNHKIKVGRKSLVGYAIRTGQAHIASDPDTDVTHLQSSNQSVMHPYSIVTPKDIDATHSQNQVLPHMRSEIALPLRSRSVTIGALDIQADTQSAFSEQNLKVLQLLADQLSAAIENAQLVQQVEGTYAELNKAYRLQSQNVWQSTIDQHERPSYEYDGIQVRSVPQYLPNDLLKRLEDGEPVILKENDEQKVDHTKTTLMVPIKVLNQVIGVIGLEREDPDHIWTDEEISIVEAAANRAGITLENARLLEESQRRATKERAIGEISAKISASTQIEMILKTAVRELGNKISDAQVSVEIESGDK